MQEKLKFMDCISTDIVYHDRVYLHDSYRDQTLFKNDQCRLQNGYYRKLLYDYKDVQGYIIGQTVKKEGKLEPEVLDYSGGGMTHFIQKKVVPFWVIATKLNKQYLIPKKLAEIRRIKKWK